MRVRPLSPVSLSRRGRASQNEALIAAAVLATVAVSVAAQPQFEELNKRGFPLHEDFTRAVALGDVDGDGGLDIVFGNQGQTRLYLNDGTGSFIDATSTRVPAAFQRVQAVALADVDGDGDPDLV